MKYRIIGKNVKTRHEQKLAAVKWLLYIMCLLAFYIVMRCGIFGFWQPVLLVPLAVAAAMHESELTSCIFAVFCGLYIDISYRFLFGFSAFWLLIVCLAVSLLEHNLIRINLLNFLWTNFAAVVLEFSMAYLFNAVIWDYPNYEIILIKSILPTMISTVVASPLVYFIVRAINIRFGKATELNRYEPAENEDEDSEANID